VGDNTRHTIILEKVAEGCAEQIVLMDLLLPILSVQLCTPENDEKQYVVCDGKLLSCNGHHEALKQVSENDCRHFKLAWRRRREALELTSIYGQ
jgi:hypothetical protein